MGNKKSKICWAVESMDVDINYVRQNLLLPWDLGHLSMNKGIRIRDIIGEYPNSTGSWNWYFLSRNIPIEEIISNPDLPWEKEGISGNQQISFKLMEGTLRDIGSGEWCYKSLSNTLPISEILSRPLEKWYMQDIARNKEYRKSLILDLPNAIGCIHTSYN